ncbi:YtxH domain-containing protein [Cellulomonas sp. PhB143]|uniref:YtxH domain-containing protein n=1 Tax=Cellulomonas sp. PhB143 TaxID=2485186 RepID=UPI000F483008|nr:YtxH domain-containing protein [Cellulomonas sp. PhB143]ROS74611.1 hypothetical protein EDF32_2358 [Cellulomonas sp. PhB143]
MNSKITLLVGLGVGYVLGSRAGRQRYEQIRTKAGELWHSDQVQSAVTTAQDKASDVAKEQGSKLADVAKEQGTKAAQAVKDKAGSALGHDSPSTGGTAASGQGEHSV